jgi:hypothetical protein
LLPNLTSMIFAQASLPLCTVVLDDALLSFLGLGTEPPTASVERMLAERLDPRLRGTCCGCPATEATSARHDMLDAWNVPDSSPARVRCRRMRLNTDKSRKRNR